MMNNKGFTLIEILLTLALLSMITAFSWPFLSSLDSNSLSVSIGQTVNVIRQSQILAQTNNQDSAWGVLINTNSASLFKGDSYASRDQVYDRETLFEKGVVAANIQEIVFTKYTGESSFVGEITMSANGHPGRQITISELGVIDY